MGQRGQLCTESCANDLGVPMCSRRKQVVPVGLFLETWHLDLILLPTFNLPIFLGG